MRCVVPRLACLTPDPECCDGSDETDGKVRCPNVCQQQAKVHRRENERLAKIHSAGSKVRDSYISAAKKDAKKARKRLAELERQVGDAQTQEQQLRSAADAAEREGKLSTEQKMQTRACAGVGMEADGAALYIALQKRKEALAHLRERGEAIFGELRVAAGFMDRVAQADDSKAIQDAVEAYRMWLRSSFGDVKDPLPLAEKLAEIEADGAWPVERLDQLDDEDLLELMESGPVVEQAAEPDESAPICACRSGAAADRSVPCAVVPPRQPRAFVRAVRDAYCGLPRSHPGDTGIWQLAEES